MIFLAGVGMNMGDAVIVRVYMELHPLTPKPVEHLQLEANQHHLSKPVFLNI